jgi:hypothetical protein
MSLSLAIFWSLLPTVIDVLSTHREGETGQMNVAPKFQLENEFGTSDTEKIIKKILLEGYLEKTMVRHHCLPFRLHTRAEIMLQNPERQGNRNVTRGALIPH